MTNYCIDQHEIHGNIFAKYGREERSRGTACIKSKIHITVRGHTEDTNTIKTMQ